MPAAPPVGPELKVGVMVTPWPRLNRPACGGGGGGGPPGALGWPMCSLFHLLYFAILTMPTGISIAPTTNIAEPKMSRTMAPMASPKKTLRESKHAAPPRPQSFHRTTDEPM